MAMTNAKGFLDALVAPQRAPELAEADDIFGFLIGSWDLEAVLHDPAGQTQKSRGELHAAWILEGRAIQDLLIVPRRADRISGPPARGGRYATTIRTYDWTFRAWRVEFTNPAAPETSARLMSRRRGEDVEMEGKLLDGSRIRWHYRSITPTSFTYGAERLHEDSRVWNLYLELFGTRAKS
jgi:hypothetical protein